MLNFAFGGFVPAAPNPNGGAGLYGPAHPGKEGHLISGNLGWAISPPYIVYGGAVELTPSQIAQLRAGLLYVNIKSAQFPDGEVRGQIIPEEEAETEPSSPPSPGPGQGPMVPATPPLNPVE